MKILARVILSMLATCVVALPTVVFIFWEKHNALHAQGFSEDCLILYGSLWLLAWFQIMFVAAWLAAMVGIWFVMWPPKKPL